MATPTIEEYLEAIYILETESPPVKSARLAEAMGVSAPTVTDTVRRLIQQGYAVLGEGKAILLTGKGREVAEALVRRHRLSERWLVDVLGMDWSRVHEEACKLEHALSPEVEERLARTLNSPTTCPHGNPIPGSSRTTQKGMVLSEARATGEHTLLRVSPEAERNPQLLDYLKANGLIPGTRFRVVEAPPWTGVITLVIGDSTVVLSAEVASHLWVE